MNSATTRLAAVLGHPVSHSRSPTMFSAAFRAAKVDAQYLAFDVQPEHLADALTQLLRWNALGASVTVPHKVNVVKLSHQVSEQARALECANCLKFTNGKISADNTDVDGFVGAVRQWRGYAKHKKDLSLVVGAGGAARACVLALATLGFKQLAVVNRGEERLHALVNWAGDSLGIEVQAVAFEALGAAMSEAKMVVHATSAQVRHQPIELPLSKQHVFFDLSYGKDLPLMKLAKRRCELAFDGEEMLIQQAARAFTWWTEKKAPVAAMRRGYRSVRTK